ncbi:hypothetical protein QE152_g30128 [Popillia japonica]|uniref:Uncharacterized protein n=1 Tax=Popillia japonica TaxID=7064 RepID=A0AAW1JFI2_POPJA
MPNIGRLRSNKRIALGGIIQCQALYTAFAWMEVCSITKYKDMTERFQRRTLLCVASGYSTISKPAIQVITGNPWLSLLAEERLALHTSILKSEHYVNGKVG